MKKVEDYFEYLKLELCKYNTPITNSILEKVKVWENFENLTEISKMLFFLYKVEGIRIANYKEWIRI
jgi:hypothetical protein